MGNFFLYIHTYIYIYISRSLAISIEKFSRASLPIFFIILFSTLLPRTDARQKSIGCCLTSLVLLSPARFALLQQVRRYHRSFRSVKIYSSFFQNADCCYCSCCFLIPSVTKVGWWHTLSNYRIKIFLIITVMEYKERRKSFIFQKRQIRPVIINMTDLKLNNNCKSFKNGIQWNVHLDDRKSHFATFCNKQNIMKIII